MKVAATCAAIALAVLMAAAISIPLFFEGFWRDEAISINIAQLPAGSVLSAIRRGDPHPPLFLFSLATWGRLFGWAELPIKVLATTFGLGSIVAIAALAWRLFGPFAAMLAAFIAVHMPLITAHITEARGYAPALAFLLAGVALLPMPRSDPSKPREVAAAILLSLACWSHYVAFLSVAGAGSLFLLAWVRSRQRLDRQRAILTIAAAMTLLPWSPVLIAHARTGIPHEAPPAAGETIPRLLAKARFLFPTADYAPRLLTAAVIVLVLLLALSGYRMLSSGLAMKRDGFLVLSFFALPVLAVFGPLGSAERYILPAAGLSAVAIAGLLSMLAELEGVRGRAFAAVAVLYFAVAAAFVAFRIPELAKAGGRWSKSGSRDFCASVTGPSALILAVPEALGPTLHYYCPGVTIAGFAQQDDLRYMDMPRQRERWLDPAGPATLARRLPALAGTPPRRFFLVETILQPGPPLHQRERAEELKRLIEQEWMAAGRRDYYGRVESITVTMMVERSAR